MIETLIACLAGLIATQTLFVRWLMHRSDEAVKQRDATNGKLIEQLTTAVSAFQSFEAAEDQIHAQILKSLATIVETQERILLLLKEGT